MKIFAHPGQRWLAALLVPAALIAAVAEWSGGVVVRGVTMHAGSRRRGSDFDQKVFLVNLSPRTLSATVFPDCGCMVQPDYVVRPFSAVVMPVTHHVDESAAAGRHSHVVTAMYRAGGHAERIDGVVDYVVPARAQHG